MGRWGDSKQGGGGCVWRQSVGVAVGAGVSGPAAALKGTGANWGSPLGTRGLESGQWANSGRRFYRKCCPTVLTELPLLVCFFLIILKV